MNKATTQPQYVPEFRPQCWDPDDILEPPPIISTKLGPLLKELGLDIVVDDPTGLWGRIDPDDIDAYIAWATTGRRDDRVVEFWRMPEGDDATTTPFSRYQQPRIVAGLLRQVCYLVSARCSHGHILVKVEFYDSTRPPLEPVELSVDHLRQILRMYRLFPEQQPWWRKVVRWLNK